MIKWAGLTVVIMFIYAQEASAQKSTRIYYDANWKETIRKVAVYYREISQTPEHDSLYHVQDYYIDEQVQMDGYYSSFKPERKNGRFSYFYQNGQKSSECTFLNNKYEGEETDWYDDGSKKSQKFYVNNYLNGKAIWWHKNGQKQSEVNYINGKRVGKLLSWYDTGEPEQIGYYANDLDSGEHTWWFKDGTIESRFVAIDGKRKWTKAYADIAWNFEAHFACFPRQ